jgi:hypothetical protein
LLEVRTIKILGGKKRTSIKGVIAFFSVFTFGRLAKLRIAPGRFSIGNCSTSWPTHTPNMKSQRQIFFELLRTPTRRHVDAEEETFQEHASFRGPGA